MTTEAPVEYLNYVICKELGWTYSELMEQPKSFVDEMLQVMEIKKKFDLKRGRR